jgi:hypothetical protein
MRLNLKQYLLNETVLRMRLRQTPPTQAERAAERTGGPAGAAGRDGDLHRPDQAADASTAAPSPSAST